jgi:hypothetical protein
LSRTEPNNLVSSLLLLSTFLHEDVVEDERLLFFSSNFRCTSSSFLR